MPASPEGAPALSLVGAGPLTPELARRVPADEVMRLMVDSASIRPVDVGDVVEVVRGTCWAPAVLR